MQPANYPRRILLCVAGLTPQIVTETLYALAVEQGDFVPTEVHVITTAAGARQIRLQLLDPEQGQFHALCRDYADYGLDAASIRFDDQTLHVIHDAAGHPLDDIRNVAHNDRAADAITEEVRRLTRDQDAAIHASIAGGRKTMGFYLGYALSLFGRSQDRLSHVLVSAPFEGNRAFFFPPRIPRVLDIPGYGPNPTPQSAWTGDARITLAEIPFVRLRGELPQDLLKETGPNGKPREFTYGEVVERTQRQLGAPELVLDVVRRRVRCGGILVELEPIDFALYAWFARRRMNGQSGLHWKESDSRELLTEYAQVVSPQSGDYLNLKAALQKSGLDKTYWDNRLAKLNKALRHALGRANAEQYRPMRLEKPTKQEKVNYRRYRLPLPPGAIRFAPLDEDGNTSPE